MSRLLKRGRTLLAMVSIAACLFVLLPSTAQSGQGGAKLSGEVEEKIRAAGADALLPAIIQPGDEPTRGHFPRLHGRGGAVKARHAAIRGYSARGPAAPIEAPGGGPEGGRGSLG